MSRGPTTEQWKEIDNYRKALESRLTTALEALERIAGGVSHRIFERDGEKYLDGCDAVKIAQTALKEIKDATDKV